MTCVSVADQWVATLTAGLFALQQHLYLYTVTCQNNQLISQSMFRYVPK